MSEINITIEGGTSKRLLTAGKYCDRDIVVTAEGGSGGSSGGSQEYQTCTVSLVTPENYSSSTLDKLIYTGLMGGEPYMHTNTYPTGIHPAMIMAGMPVQAGKVANIDVVVGTQFVIGEAVSVPTTINYRLSGNCRIYVNSWETAEEFMSRGDDSVTLTRGADQIGHPIMIDGDCTIEAW